MGTYSRVYCDQSGVRQQAYIDLSDAEKISVRLAGRNTTAGNVASVELSLFARIFLQVTWRTHGFLDGISLPSDSCLKAWLTKLACWEPKSIQTFCEVWQSIEDGCPNAQCEDRFRWAYLLCLVLQKFQRWDMCNVWQSLVQLFWPVCCIPRSLELCQLPQAEVHRCFLECFDCRSPQCLSIGQKGDARPRSKYCTIWYHLGWSFLGNSLMPSANLSKDDKTL